MNERTSALNLSRRRFRIRSVLRTSALARHAGVHLFNDRDETLYASRSFLTLAADAAGRRQIQLPRRGDVFGPFTGERLGRGVKIFERDFQARETVILRLA